MNSACTNLVLDGFFALLACRKCKQTPENPVTFVNCGHFFCDSCVKDDTVCRQCKAPVRSDDIRPYHTISQLINYCKTIKEMVSDLDTGDLWTLANAIHQFTEEQSARVEETESYKNDAVAQKETNGKDNTGNSEPEHVEFSSRDSVHRLRCTASNMQPERLRIADSKQTNQRLQRADEQLDSLSFEHSREIRQRCKSNLQPDRMKFSHSKQLAQRQVKSDLQPQAASFVHSIEINQRCAERSELEPENVRFLHGKEIEQEYQERDSRLKIGSAVRMQEIRQKSREIELQQSENLSIVRSVELRQTSREEELQQPANVSFVHSTQISQKRTERDAESETPGYIDPTQLSPIHRESDYELDTPGYRDPTQSIHQLDYSNVGSETPGYIDPTQVIQHYKKTNENPPSSLLNAESSAPVRSKSWLSDMELEEEEGEEQDTDSYHSNSQRNRHDVLAQETLEMEVSSCEGSVVPESLDVDEDLQDERDNLPAGNATNSNSIRRSDGFVDKNLLREIGRMRSRQRKTFPLSDCDTLGIAGEFGAKAPQKLHRRLTESALDRRDKTPNEDFDTLKISDVLDSFTDENPDDYKLAAGRQLESGKRFAQKARRNSFEGNDRDVVDTRKEPIVLRDTKNSAETQRNWIVQNERIAPRIATNERGKEINNEVAPSKQLGLIRSDLRRERQNRIRTVNVRDTPKVTELEDSPKETEASFEAETTLRNIQSRIPMAEDDTISITNVEMTPMGIVNTVEKTQPKLPRHARDKAKFSCANNGTAVNYDDTIVSIASTRHSRPEVVEMEKEEGTPVERLGRMSNDWDANRQQRTSNNRHTMDIASFAHNDVEKKKVAPPQQLRRIRNLKLDRQDRNSIDRNPMNPRDAQNSASIMNDSTTERTERRAEPRPVNNCARVKNLAIDRLHRDSMSDRDTLDLANGADLAETEDFEARYINEEEEEGDSPTKRQNNNIFVANCETTKTTNVQEDSPMRVAETLKKPPPRHIRRLTDWPLNRPNRDDATNDFGVANVSNVGDSVTNVDKISEIRVLRPLGRLQNPKPGHETLKPCDLHECDITNIQDFAKEQAAPLAEKIALPRGKMSLKRPSKSPPNDHPHHRPLPVATAEPTAAGQTPLKQLRSVENLETDSQNKIPAKRPKAKVVQLKPRRRIVEKSATGPKVPPKNVNKRNTKGETALHTACVKGQDDYVKTLLEAGANPNTKDNANWTPLQEAVKLGRREICEMLLQFGASANTPGIENRTALHDASENDKLEEAALLLRFNASRDVYDKYGNRPIDYAASDAMRALLADDNPIEKISGEAVCLNSTLDQSILMPNPKVVVLPSNLSTVNKKALTQIASKLKIAVASSFRPGITHIIVEANERNSTDLTYYVMLAILQGIWILNSQWIAISVDLTDISQIDLELFEVHGAPNPGTPERSRMNEEKQHPRLFNNCFFFFTIGARGTWKYGNLEFSKNNLTNLVLAGQGEVLRREPDPEDLKDSKITPFHVANKPLHPLHRCAHYIIYMPGKDEPRIKYNMPHVKTLPLAWLLECIEKFALVDPKLIGIS